MLHKWNSPPELINFIYRTGLRGMHSVAGNHDLPNHAMDDIKRSGYKTLCDMDVIQHLDNSLDLFDEYRLILCGVSCGETTLDEQAILKEINAYKGEDLITVAVVHDMVWNCRPFPDVPMDKQASEQARKYKHFDVVLFADNHLPVWHNTTMSSETSIANCGCLMPTRADEKDTDTCVALLMSDRTVNVVSIPEEIASQNKWREDDDLNDSLIVNGVSHSLEDFLETVRDLSDVSLNFHDAIRRYLKIEKPTSNIRDRLMAIIDEIQDN